MVSNSVTVTDANLNLDFGTVPFVPAAGETYTIIDLTHVSNTVTGTFAGKPNGGIFVAGGNRFGIRYDAGTGNDVVLYGLVLIPEPATLGLLAAAGLFALRRRR